MRRVSELRTGPRSLWTDGESPVPPDSWGRASSASRGRKGSANRALPWGFALVIVLLVVGRFALTPHLTAPALRTWATIFVAICVQALPFLVFGVALSAAITAFVPASFWTRALPWVEVTGTWIPQTFGTMPNGVIYPQMTGKSLTRVDPPDEQYE